MALQIRKLQVHSDFVRMPFLGARFVKSRWATDPGPRNDISDESKMFFQGSRKSDSKMTPTMTFPWERVKF